MNAGDGWDKILFVTKFVALDVGDDDVDFHGGCLKIKSTLKLKVMERNWDLQVFIGEWGAKLVGLNCEQRFV